MSGKKFKGISSLDDMLGSDLQQAFNKNFKISGSGISEFTMEQIRAKASVMGLTESLTTEAIALAKDADFSAKSIAGKMKWGEALKDSSASIEDIGNALLKSNQVSEEAKTGLKAAAQNARADSKYYENYKTVVENIINGGGGFENISDRVIDLGDRAQEAGGGISNVFKGIAASIKPLLPAIGAVTAAVGAFAIWDYSQHGFTRAAEEAAEAAAECDEVQSRVDSLNSELGTTNARIEELQALKDAGTISFAEEVELEKLKNVNSELERQKDIEEGLLGIKQKASAQKAVNASTTEKTYTEAMEEEYGGFWGKIIGFFGGAGSTVTDPETGKPVAKSAAEIWEEQYNGDTSITGLVSGDLKSLGDLEDELKGVQDQLKDDSSNETLANSQEHLKQKIEDTTSKLRDQAAMLQEWIDQSTDENGNPIGPAIGHIDDWRKSLTDIQNYGKSQDEIDLNNLNNLFDSTGGDLIKDRLNTIAEHGGTAKEALKELEAAGLSLSKLNITEGGFTRYFEDLKKAAEEAKEVIHTVEGTVEGVTKAFETDNQDKNWATMAKYLSQAAELYEDGKVGTDDFKTSVQFMAPDIIDPDVTDDNGKAKYKYDADAYVEAWKEARQKVKRYFDSENPLASVTNFADDLTQNGLAVKSGNEYTWTEQFESSAKAADALGISVEAAETLMHNLESHGFEFKGVEWSGENFKRYEASLEKIKGLRDNTTDSDEKQRLDGLIENWDQELAGYKTDMEDLTEDKVVHIEFEYSLAQIQNEIDKVKASIEAGANTVENHAKVITGNDEYINNAESCEVQWQIFDLQINFITIL